jgi:hypothetical protein
MRISAVTFNTKAHANTNRQALFIVTLSDDEHGAFGAADGHELFRFKAPGREPDSYHLSDETAAHDKVAPINRHV